MAMPARWDGSACWGNWSKGGPAALPTFQSLVELSYPSFLVSGSRGRVFMLRERGPPSPSPASPRRLCAPPDFMPTRTRASRQCLPIQVPVCPHNTFVHLAWQIGAHAKMGKKTLRPGWQIGSGFFLSFLVKVLLTVTWLQLHCNVPFRRALAPRYCTPTVLILSPCLVQ